MCISYTFISNAYFIRIFQLFLYTKPISPYSKERLDHIFFLRSCLSSNIQANPSLEAIKHLWKMCIYFL